MKIENKKIIIHAGPGKTGSSAIQAWLATNRDILKAKKIYYPEHLISENKISSGNLDSIMTCNEAGQWEIDKEKISILIRKFNHSLFETLLLSSEYFFQNIEEIKKAIPSAQFLIYIRNPLDLLESNYNQGVKRHAFTQKFSAPAALNRVFWDSLSSLFKNYGINSFIIRPYYKNIVNDFLSYFDIDGEYNEQRVNLSYTLPALEFKRLINHFDIGALQPKVDNLLQNYQDGKKTYSFIEPEAFAKLNEQCCVNIQEFIDKNKFTQLKNLVKAFKQSKQKQYVDQNASLSDLVSVAKYIRKNDPYTYNKLKNRVEQNSNLIVDNNAIYHCFDVKPQSFDKAALIEVNLYETVMRFGVHKSKPPKICYELAQYYLTLNDYESSFKFAKAAYYFDSDSHQIVKKLNEVLMLLNKLEHKESLNESLQVKAENLKNRVKKLFDYVVVRKQNKAPNSDSDLLND